jgi:hypothetical protein
MKENPVKDCVALKAIKHEDDWDIFNNEVGILKEFAKLEKEEHRRHLVKFYQYGHIVMNNTGHRARAYTMELGEKSLADYFKKNAVELREGKIEEITKDIALAMRDFHRGNKQ